MCDAIEDECGAAAVVVGGGHYARVCLQGTTDTDGPWRRAAERMNDEVAAAAAEGPTTIYDGGSGGGGAVRRGWLALCGVCGVVRGFCSVMSECGV